jgi:uncharacterized protein YjbI with pentapeptide repeats
MVAGGPAMTDSGRQVFHITRDVLAAHHRWVERGSGPGRLVVANGRLEDSIHMGENLRGASFTSCELAGMDISVVGFERAEFVGCDFHDCMADTTSFEEATITSCTFTDVRLVTAFFNDVRVTGCVFRTGAGSRRMTMARTGWRGAKVVDCRFENVHLDMSGFGASTFERCAFPGAIFRNTDFCPDAMFRDCDFTGADVAGVTFAGGHFERCKGLPDWLNRLLKQK